MRMPRIWLNVSDYLLVVVALVGVLAIAASALAQSAGRAQDHTAPHLDYRCDAPAALFWAASALSGDPMTDQAAWRAWWQQHPAATEDLQRREKQAIEAFGRLRATYRGRFLEGAPRPNPWVPLPPSSDHRLEVRFAALFLGAHNAGELLQRAEVLMADSDRADLQEIAAVWLPKLASMSAAEGEVCGFARSFASYAERAGLGEFLSRAAPLFDASAGGAVTVQFVATLSGDKMRGRRLGNYLVVEVGSGQRPEHRADVVVHEACHWLQERGGMEVDPALINALYSAEDSRAARAWELLAEGTATALGQGLWAGSGHPAQLPPGSPQPQVGSPRRWYEDDQIDAFARALAPVLHKAIEQGAPLKARVPQILAAVPPPPPAVRAQLHRYVLLSDHRDSPWLAGAWFAQVPPRAVWRAELAEALPWAQKAKGATLVVVATWKELKGVDVAKLGAALAPPGLHKRAAVFSGVRSGGARLLVVAAPDETALAVAAQGVAAGPWPGPGWSAVAAPGLRP